MAEDQDFLAGKRCLVLDDEFLIALDIQQVLESAGAAAVACHSTVGDTLDSIARGPAFDVAVLDVKLEGKSGDSQAVAAALKRRGTPFVFLTGLRSGDLRTSAFPGVPVVEKPYQADALLAAVRQALGR